MAERNAILKMAKPWRLLFCLAFLSSTDIAFANERIELDTTTITGNTELPKYLYVVPWQDKKSKNKEQQKLVLHNLYSDLFDPVMPAYISVEKTNLVDLKEK